MSYLPLNSGEEEEEGGFRNCEVALMEENAELQLREEWSGVAQRTEFMASLEGYLRSRESNSLRKFSGNA
ncbi:hypothetical protein RHGRI_032387 [Rhododendron griersonianum]|uniref:Uncharacterized protein n=1 Tax=Rhododendron griersonianum TaxID=479676 RepID=A0AAV6ICA8_9ERIC|nr:hypothetical protein RHGRI_032387 [Rhododendron griersonianum]